MSNINKVKIQGNEDRNNMVNALANNGHKVCVEKEESKEYLIEKDYYVCYELKKED